MIVPALRPGTRCDPSGVSVRGRWAGGVRQWDPYQGNLIGGVRSHVEKERNLLGFVLAWATVPVVRPGTRCDPCWVSVRGRMAGGVRRWDSYPGNWVGGVGAHAKTKNGSADDGIHRYYITGRSCLTPGASDDVLLRLCTPTVNDACGREAATMTFVRGT